MDQKFVIAANSNPNDLRAIMYEISAPSTPVGLPVDIPAPHAVDQNAIFNGLDPVVHYFRLFEVVGGVLGSMIAEFEVQPTKINVETPDDIELNVGGAPEDELAIGGDSWDGSVDYPELVGLIAKQDYRIVQRGIGPLKDREYEDDSTLGSTQPEGTAFKWKLTGGATFVDGDTYFVQFLPSLIVNPADFQVGNNNSISDISTVTADISFDAVYLNKLIDINSLTNKITVTLPPIADWPDMRPIEFVTNRGSQINAIIKAQPGELIYDDGAETNEVIMGKSEHLRLVKKGARIYVEYFTGTRDLVGQVVWAYRQPKNSHPADGSVALKAVYARAWKEVNALGIGNGVVSNGDWLSDTTTHRGKFADVDANNFRFPDLRGVAVRGLDQGRGLDTVRAAAGTGSTVASYEADGNKTHSHRVNTGGNAGGGANPGKSLIRQNYNGDNYISEGTGSSSHGPYIESVGNSEATMKNVGLKPYIMI